MLRWLGLLLAIGLVSTSAEAQVFKPKASTTKKSDSGSSTKSSSKKETSSKKSARVSPSKKRVTTKSKKNQAAERGRPDDLTPDAAPKESDKDFVKITDDDDIE